MDPFVLLVLLFLCGAASDPEVISQGPGENVTLTCRSADRFIVVVEWTRTDLKPKNVLFYRDGHLTSRNQHPSFQGRVQLVDGDLKDGDASLILKNVSSSDEGTYECRVKVDNSTRKKRAIIDDPPISRVRLQVTDSHHAAEMDGDKEEEDHTHMHIGLAAAGVLVCLAVVGLFVFRKSKRRLNNEPEAPADDEAERVVIM